MSFPYDLSHLGYQIGQPMAAPSSTNLATFGAPGMTTGVPLFSQDTGSNLVPPLTGSTQAQIAPKGLWDKMGGMEGLSSLLQGIGSLGSIYSSLQGIGIAKDQLAFSKEAYRTNLANTTKSYNTALEDRIRSRYVTENRGAGEADTYIDKHKL